MVGTVMNRQAVVVMPGTSLDVFPWDKHAVPLELYKYLPPERFHVLTDCLIRFSQRQVFEDVFELRPEITNFGNEEEIRKFMQIDPVLSLHPEGWREAVIRHVLDTPGRESALIAQTQAWLKAPDEFGVLCFTEDPASDDMWEKYADHGRGFMVAFDTRHSSFDLLRMPGRLGKVEYSDEPFPSFLSTYGVNTFFRKRTRYEFEKEWRSIRALRRFYESQVLRPQGGLAIYRAVFDPACVSTILIRPDCAIESELRTLTANRCSVFTRPSNFDVAL